MNVGDLLFDTLGTQILWVIMSIDYHTGKFQARQLTDDTGALFYDNINVPPIWTTSDMSDVRFFRLRWSDVTVVKILAQRSLPGWVSNINTAASHIHNGQGPVPTLKQHNPIGSMFIGSGRTMNVWIVNKQNSDEISLLWDGKNGRWCGSELERPDRISPQSTISTSTPSEVISFINKNFAKTFAMNSFPPWAMKLFWTAANPAPQAKPQAQGMSPAVTSAMIKANIISPPKEEMQKRVVTAQELCKHEYRQYVGFSHIYEYCIICDAKRSIKQ